MVFTLLIVANLIDENNFVRVCKSAVIIYEGRLMANDLIFEMLKSFKQKELPASLSDSLFFKIQN
jgi:hypothetical protein